MKEKLYDIYRNLKKTFIFHKNNKKKFKKKIFSTTNKIFFTNCDKNNYKLTFTQKEENPCSSGFYQNFCNQFSKTLKIREIITNFETSKKISKLKKALNAKKCEQIETNFDDEKKLICYKCSCPYLRILTENKFANENSSQEHEINNSTFKY